MGSGNGRGGRRCREMLIGPGRSEPPSFCPPYKSHKPPSHTFSILFPHTPSLIWCHQEKTTTALNLFDPDRYHLPGNDQSHLTLYSTLPTHYWSRRLPRGSCQYAPSAFFTAEAQLHCYSQEHIVSMSEQASFTGYPAREHWGHKTFTSSLFYREYPTHQPGICWPRPRQALPCRPRLHEYDRSGRTTASESGTLVHAQEYAWMSKSGHSTPIDGRGNLAYKHTAATTPKRTDRLPPSKFAARARFLEWTEPSQRDGVPQPPRTPQIRRLPTPELEPPHCSDRFCDCQSCGGVSYEKGRAKMDGQREYMSFSMLMMMRAWDD